MHPFDRPTADEVMERQRDGDAIINFHRRVIMAELYAKIWPAFALEAERLAKLDKPK